MNYKPAHLSTYIVTPAPPPPFSYLPPTNYYYLRYKSIGFLSCYNYYCYPNKKRPRISQVLVLPPYQKCGHGAKLLTAMYEHSCADPLVCDITVEDPSENFTRLRNFVDALKCSSLPSFQPDKLKDGFSKVSCPLFNLVPFTFHRIHLVFHLELLIPF